MYIYVHTYTHQYITTVKRSAYVHKYIHTYVHILSQDNKMLGIIHAPQTQTSQNKWSNSLLENRDFAATFHLSLPTRIHQFAITFCASAESVHTHYFEKGTAHTAPGSDGTKDDVHIPHAAAAELRA